MAKYSPILVASTLLALLCVCTAGSLNLDVHIEFGDEDFFRKLDKELHQLLPNNQIDLTNRSWPHVTLYLTNFVGNQLDDVISGTRSVVKSISQNCPIYLTDITISGNYAMWDVKTTPCLQKWSDMIVNSVSPYIVPDQPIPDWVLTLPEPTRTQKIEMIKKYGSPNVFSQFQPHVTLAWDDKEPMEPAFQKLNLQPRTVYPRTIAIGGVGPYGTVLRGFSYARFNLNVTRDDLH